MKIRNKRISVSLDCENYADGIYLEGWSPGNVTAFISEENLKEINKAFEMVRMFKKWKEKEKEKSRLAENGLSIAENTASKGALSKTE